MAGRKSKLTEQVQQQIVSFMRAGAFDWVAAQAAGIGKTTFYRWMQAGEAGRRPYAQFYEAVCEARAQARVAAETEVRRDNPLAWLRYGPGRARPDEPGWTESREISFPGKEVSFTLDLGEITGSSDGDEEGNS